MTCAGTDEAMLALAALLASVFPSVFAPFPSSLPSPLQVGLFPY